MPPALRARFLKARLDPDAAVFLDRNQLARGDASMIQCDGWLVPAKAPTEDVGGVLLYVDTDDKDTWWHRYYCGEEHNDNRCALGPGLVGWAIGPERVAELRRSITEAKGGAR